MIHEGAPSSSVILHVPHSSTTIPADVRRGILLDDDALDLELLRMTDSYTDRIAATAAADAGLIARYDTHTPQRLVDVAAEAFCGFGTVGINEPFIGTYVPLAHYGTDLRVRSIMLEVRRDLYMDESSGAPDEGALRALGAALARLIDSAAG